jgi:hypothetical protein
MAHYIIQVFVFQLLFFLVYQLLLRQETFFTYNRLYLLGTAALSFMLPFMQFDVINQQIPNLFRVELPAVFIGDTSPEVTSLSQSLDPIFITQSTIAWGSVFLTVYILGVLFSALIFVLKLRKLAGIRKIGNFTNTSGYRICEIPNSKEAFTFLRTMYLGAAISEAEKAHITAHEKVHIDQWHTLDLLVFEILKMVFWFNPMVYLFQKQLQSVHEFTADQMVAKQDKTAYYQNLLSQVFGTTSISFINTFFNQSLIKKRIIMLQKSKSNRVSALKYLLVIPFIAGMLAYTSCANETEDTSVSSQDTEVMQKITALSEAIMKVGELTDEESNALKLLTTENQSGDKIYLSVEEYIKDSNEEGVPMSVIENVPTYPGCEGNNDEKKACFSEKLTKYIVNNFDTSVADNSNLTGNTRFVVQFKINKVGIVQDVSVRAPLPELEREAKRVINQLPKMKPGTQKGEAVNVMYSLPIVFKINA